MTVMMQTLSVSKEAFSLLSTFEIAAVGMDIKVYRHTDPSIGAQTKGLLQYSNGCHGSS